MDEKKTEKKKGTWLSVISSRRIAFFVMCLCIISLVGVYTNNDNPYCVLAFTIGWILSEIDR